MRRFATSGVLGWLLVLACVGGVEGQQGIPRMRMEAVLPTLARDGTFEVRVAGDVFSDVRLRMALLHAVDWRSLPQVHAVWFGYERADLTALAYDPARAEMLLWEAGRGAGFGFDMMSERDATGVAEALRAHLDTIGVLTEIRVASDEDVRLHLAELIRTGARGVAVLSTRVEMTEAGLGPEQAQHLPDEEAGAVGVYVFGRVFDDGWLRLAFLQLVDWHSLPQVDAVWFGDDRVDLVSLAVPYDPVGAHALISEVGLGTAFHLSVWSPREVLPVAETLHEQLTASGWTTEVHLGGADIGMRLEDACRSDECGVVVLRTGAESAGADDPEPQPDGTTEPFAEGAPPAQGPTRLEPPGMPDPAQRLVVRVVGAAFEDARVRWALMHAVDWRAFPDVRSVSFDADDCDVAEFPYDPARARQLHAEAGWPSGYEVEVWTSPTTASAAGTLRSQLGLVGVSVEVLVASDDDVHRRLAEQARIGGRTIGFLRP